MTKTKGSGSFRGTTGKTGPQPPAHVPNRPMPPSVPRIMPRTKASPKGR